MEIYVIYTYIYITFYFKPNIFDRLLNASSDLYHYYYCYYIGCSAYEIKD